MDDSAEKPLRRGGESDSAPSSSDYSSSEEEARRRRRRKDKKRHSKREEDKSKHKRRRRKHSSSSSDSSEDDSDDKTKRRRKRRHHSSDDDNEGKKKRKRHHSDHEKHEKHERRKKRTHHSSDDESSESESERRKKKKLLKEAKKILKQHKAAEKGSQDQKAGISKKVEQISEDDYYQRNNEFATWLKERHGLYFSNMSSEESRKMFANFVDVWNSGKLADKYYEGIKTGQRTNHKWNFEDKQVDEEEERLKKRKREKAEQKKFLKEHELVMDELLPKATGKDRLFEKKAIQREKNRNRDLSPEPMRETDIMGGGDDFKMMLARERARREKRVSQKAEVLQKKLSVVEEKEAAAMDQFRALVNTSGGKITIPKRDA